MDKHMRMAEDIRAGLALGLRIPIRTADGYEGFIIHVLTTSTLIVGQFDGSGVNHFVDIGLSELEGIHAKVDAATR